MIAGHNDLEGKTVLDLDSDFKQRRNRNKAEVEFSYK